MKKKCILIINRNKKIYVNTKNCISLLSILLLNQINIDYQCKKGYCGTCKVVLIKGKILYQSFSPLAFLKPGEILSCCCIVEHNIEIKI
ncbi:class I ribonucleotide reductase maintenance protein YfaE [Buchnera aphidicola (Mindarus keteleerifoliae)]|uniref:class I ribonucleotide reductase maintenance protein YfaE n=1 Tax=Buchnera aphidicola TaxID=9 RepID=UPI0031B6DD99